MSRLFAICKPLLFNNNDIYWQSAAIIELHNIHQHFNEEFKRSFRQAQAYLILRLHVELRCISGPYQIWNLNIEHLWDVKCLRGKFMGPCFAFTFFWKGSNCLLTVPHDLLIPYLKWLNKCVEENSDRDASPEKLDESRSSEQLEEADLDELCDVDNTSNHCDKVKGVPGVFEIVLENIMQD